MCMKNGIPHSAQKASSEGPRVDILVQNDEVDDRSPDFMMGVVEQCSEREAKLISYMIPRAGRKCQANRKHRHLNCSRIALLRTSIRRERKRPGKHLNISLRNEKRT